jgi:hypothetical protein
MDGAAYLTIQHASVAHVASMHQPMVRGKGTCSSFVGTWSRVIGKERTLIGTYIPYRGTSWLYPCACGADSVVWFRVFGTSVDGHGHWLGGRGTEHVLSGSWLVVHGV